MLTILAAQIKVPDPPKLPPGTTDTAKDFLRPLLTSTTFWWLVMAAIVVFMILYGNLFVRLLGIGIAAAVVVGWDSTNGVSVAMAGGNQHNADSGLLGLLIGGAAVVLLTVKGATRKRRKALDEQGRAREALGALLGGGQSKKRGRRGR
jgi:uncharacterized membrane protein YccC